MQTNGSLADRSLAVVLLELARRNATGVLRIAHSVDAAELVVIEGALCKLLYDRRAPAYRIGQILLRERAITVGQLQECLVQQERTLRRLGEILIDFDYATPQQVGDALREQAADGCVDLLSLREGDFHFYRNVESIAATDFSPVDLNELVADFIASTETENGVASERGKEAGRGSKPRRLLAFGKTMGLFGAIGLGCALSLQLVLLDRFNLFRGPKPLIVESDALRQGVARLNLQRLQRALEIHRWLDGRYPEHLDDLVRAGLVKPGDIHYPFHSKYVYVPAKDGYTLELPLR